MGGIGSESLHCTNIARSREHRAGDVKQMPRAGAAAERRRWGIRRATTHAWPRY